MMLAWIFRETELIIQVPTILSAWIQTWIADGEFTTGDNKVRVPSMKPSLLAMRNFLADRAQAR